MPHWYEKLIKKKELKETGVYIGDIHNKDGHHRLFICLLRGMLVFFACYGTVVGVIEAFSLPYNMPLVTVFFFFISMLVALLYWRKLLFYPGYILILIVFTSYLVKYYLYANSGYQAIINQIYSEYSDYFKLLSVREAQEFFSNRYVTVTIAMCFIGTFLALLLNVTISGYMNLLETILITFPFLEIAFFIELKPPVYCIILLLSVYFCVGIQQAMGTFRMQVKGKNSPEFIRFKRKKETKHIYQSSASGTLKIYLFSLAVSLILGLCFIPTYYANKTESAPNALRAEADNLVKIFVQNGFTGLFDRYDSTGGLNHGHLGGVSNVRPDFETDIKVTFAPYTYDTVYLKSFTGNYYQANTWYSHTYTEERVFLSGNDIQTFDHLYMPTSEAKGKMTVENVDLVYSLPLLPYYSVTEQETIPLGESLTVSYSPHVGTEYPKMYDELPEAYDTYIHEKCLYVPETIRAELADYCIEAEFTGIATSTFTEPAPGTVTESYDPVTGELISNASFEEINAYRLALANEVYAHFIKDFSYTMAPGSTPYNKDYVEYFLTTQKRGFCAHFASSAVMLLRTMGVPARYVEGYCIPATLIADDAKPVAGESTADWYSGPSELSEQGVISLEVNDSYAHAWIEIYLEGYGFVPFEVTPADFGNENEGLSDLAELFSGLFSFEFNLETDLEDVVAQPPELPDEEPLFPRLSLSAKALLVPLCIFFGVLAGILLMFFIIRLILISYKRNKWLKEGNYKELVYEKYEILNKKIQKQILSKRNHTINENPLPDELCKLLSSHLSGDKIAKKATSFPEVNYERFAALLNKALYSSKGITPEEYKEILNMFKDLTKQLSFTE